MTIISDQSLRNIMYLFAVGVVVLLLFIGAIPQDISYHDFADKREMLGIPNFMDVVTNIPFAVVGSSVNNKLL